LAWGLRIVKRELDFWRGRAEQITALPIRWNALTALSHKRGNTDGAALFWIIPQVRSYPLLKLLATYQVMWDFLDNASETGTEGDYRNGAQLHLALVEALDPSQSLSDYYFYHQCKSDDGYLRSLVEACQHLSASLPSFERVRPTVLREAKRAGVQALNHDNNSGRREAALRLWAYREYPDGIQSATWFELTAAAGAGISIYALFALAAEPVCGQADIAELYGAYFPWASALATMLDSYVDQQEDTIASDHIYIEHYGSRAMAHNGIQRLITRTLKEMGALPNCERHILVIACMIAMYLSKSSALCPEQRATTIRFLSAAGSLPMLLWPALWLWRTAYGVREC
jgi:tetraprenyl-beta-curcumene synthase